MEKTKVKFKNKLKNYSEIEPGDRGYISGHVQGADGVPYIVVVVPDKGCIVYASFYDLEVIY